MTRHRCLHSDRTRLQIADLTDHYDIWILTHESLQSCCVGIVFFLIDFALDDSLELVLDRIFERYDLAIGGVQGGEE
jgi:hypothetical protein